MRAFSDNEEMAGFGWAVGCDICQETCPWNRFQSPTVEERFWPQKGRIRLSLTDLPQELNGTAFARCKREGLVRNIKRASKKY